MKLDRAQVHWFNTPRPSHVTPAETVLWGYAGQITGTLKHSFESLNNRWFSCLKKEEGYPKTVFSQNDGIWFCTQPGG